MLAAVPVSGSDGNVTFLVEDHRLLTGSPSRPVRRWQSTGRCKISGVDGGVCRTADGSITTLSSESTSRWLNDASTIGIADRKAGLA